jgi:quinolinate synthase
MSDGRMISADELREEKKKYPEAAVVCYVNSTAGVKAESDICCTSANAVKVVNSLDQEEILFVPDQNLGHYASRNSDKRFRFWPGYCPTHARILSDHIYGLKQEYPQASVVVHPECRPDVIDLADAALSTSGILQYAARDDVSQMIVGTEIGMIYRLKKENPGKQFIPISEQAVCPNMKMITLEKVLWTLEEMSPQITVPEEVRVKAKASITRMLDLS